MATLIFEKGKKGKVHKGTCLWREKSGIKIRFRRKRQRKSCFGWNYEKKREQTFLHICLFVSNKVRDWFNGEWDEYLNSWLNTKKILIASIELNERPQLNPITSSQREPTFDLIIITYTVVATVGEK